MNLYNLKTRKSGRKVRTYTAELSGYKIKYKVLVKLKSEYRNVVTLKTEHKI